MEERIEARDLHCDMVSVFDPEGNLVVETDNMLVIDDMRVQAFEKGIEGYTAECGGTRVPLMQAPWPFNHQEKEILARLILARNEFNRKRLNSSR